MLKWTVKISNLMEGFNQPVYPESETSGKISPSLYEDVLDGTIYLCHLPKYTTLKHRNSGNRSFTDAADLTPRQY